MRQALAVAGCGVLGVTLTACESTEQESAKLSREGQRAASSSQGTLKLGAINRSVRAADVTLLSGGGRTAVALSLTATSSNAQANVPLLVSVTGARGKTLYSNATAGLEASLQSIALLHPGQREWWVDDQVLTSQTPTGVKVRVGTGTTPRSRATPALVVGDLRVSRQSGESVLSGTVVNHSSTAEERVPVFAVGIRGGRVVAAGRAVIESLPAGSSTPVPFQIFLVGNASGASMQATAVASGG